MISSDTAVMSGMSCSMITIEHCVARCMSFRSGPSASVSRWATPDDGSSRSSTVGLWAMAMVRSTMRRTPVESSETNLSR